MKRVEYIEEYNPYYFMEKGDRFEVLKEEDDLYLIHAKGYDRWIIQSRFKVIDSVVEDVIDSFRERSSVGINKYNTTLDRSDLKPLEWLQHLQEELMDATLYVEKLKREL